MSFKDIPLREGREKKSLMRAETFGCDRASIIAQWGHLWKTGDCTWLSLLYPTAGGAAEERRYQFSLAMPHQRQREGRRTRKNSRIYHPTSSNGAGAG